MLPALLTPHSTWLDQQLRQRARESISSATTSDPTMSAKRKHARGTSPPVFRGCCWRGGVVDIYGHFVPISISASYQRCSGSRPVPGPCFRPLKGRASLFTSPLFGGCSLKRRDLLSKIRGEISGPVERVFRSAICKQTSCLMIIIICRLIRIIMFVDCFTVLLLAAWRTKA